MRGWDTEVPPPTLGVDSGRPPGRVNEPERRCDMSDEKYQGFANYETWLVDLWLGSLASDLDSVFH